METPAGMRKNRKKFCHLHWDHKHNNNKCFELKEEIETLIHQGHLHDLMAIWEGQDQPWRHHEMTSGCSWPHKWAGLRKWRKQKCLQLNIYLKELLTLLLVM